MPVYAQLGGLEVLEELGRRGDPPAHDGAGRGPDRRAPAPRDFDPRWPPRPEDRTGIVMLPSADPAADVRRLADAGIVADSRPGHVRISPYFYNVPDDHRAAIERLTRD